MRWVACVCILTALGNCKEEMRFIPGSGALPDCSETPVRNLDGTIWSDSGLVTTHSPDCDVTPGVPHLPCHHHWAFTQSGNDVAIIVDGEYRIEGRLCGDELHLRGGWRLSLEVGLVVCMSRDDPVGEMSIQAEGNVLRVSAFEMMGTLAVRGRCSADYDVTFQQALFASLN